MDQLDCARLRQFTSQNFLIQLHAHYCSLALLSSLRLDTQSLKWGTLPILSSKTNVYQSHTSLSGGSAALHASVPLTSPV